MTHCDNFILFNFILLLLGKKKDLDLQNWLHNPPNRSGPKDWKLWLSSYEDAFLIVNFDILSWVCFISQVRIPPATGSFSYQSCKCRPSLPGFSKINGAFHNARRLCQAWRSWRSLSNASSIIFWEKPGAILAKTCWQPVLRHFLCFLLAGLAYNCHYGPWLLIRTQNK